MATQRRVIAAGTLLVLIYALQFLSARASLQGHITPTGLTIIRFYAAGALFIPYLGRPSVRHAIKQLGWIKIASLAALAGFPYLIVINTGIAITSAGYVAAVGPGSIVLFSFLLPLLLLKARPERAAIVSTSLITIGILLFIYNTLLTAGLSSAGTALFVLQGLMFSMYGVLLKRWHVSPVLATAVVALSSCLPAVIAHFSVRTGFAEASQAELLIQAVTQGVLAGAAAIFLYGYLVLQAGPQRASLVMPSVPIITTAGGYFFLKESLGLAQLLGLAAMAAGMSVPGLAAIYRKYPTTARSG